MEKKNSTKNKEKAKKQKKMDDVSAKLRMRESERKG